MGSEYFYSMKKLENTYATLPGSLFTFQKPVTVIKPELILWNSELSELLNLSIPDSSQTELASTFSGNQLLDGSIPLAQAYAGHQFAHFTMLGDGRAIFLGEHIDSKGQRWDIQLKGSGVTPYSRGGDGRATLHAMLREYLFSEAMFYLHIPTSRSLAVVSTGEPVYRLNQEKGAVLTRVMKSHIRIGTFQYASHLASKKALEELTSYTILRLYPRSVQSPNPALSLLSEVMNQQIRLIVDWLRVGFIQGVMNTDNTSISGESFDYGPASFMNYYSPFATTSSIDTQKRYAFSKQPSMLQWNLYRFAEALLPIIHDDPTKAIKLAEDTLDPFSSLFESQYLTMLKNKLGIFGEDDGDKNLIDRLLRLMESKQADYTNTFVSLMYPGTSNQDTDHDFEFEAWRKDWLFRIEGERGSEDSLHLMELNNPRIIPRSHVVEEALNKAVVEGDFTLFTKLLEALQQTYTLNTFSTFMEPPSREFNQRYKTYCNT
jgi:uncharacterized protein YdiU (UPF0061 family)